MNDESEHVPDQEARGIFSFAGLSSHGMNPCNHFISCPLSFSHSCPNSCFGCLW